MTDDMAIATLKHIAVGSPPNSWEHYDGDYAGYGAYGDPAYVAPVDMSNSGDIHDHGVAVGQWYSAQDARRTLAVMARLGLLDA